MSAVLDKGSAPIALRVLQAFRTCGGRGLVIGRADPEATSTAASAEIELALASRLGEREAAGEQADTVVLRLHSRDDAGWVGVAMPWLVERGRRVVLRTPAVLPRSLAAAARDRGGTVFLEIASSDADVQRALHGRGADPVPSLLLHAQHLRALGVEPSAFIGPLLPMLHDRPTNIEPLLRHVAAADLRDARLSVGSLSPTRVRALQEVLPWAQVAAIARAYGATMETLLPPHGTRLDRLTEQTLYHGVRRIAEDVGIRIDHCGCPAHCHLARAKPFPFRPLLTPSLFAAS